MKLSVVIVNYNVEHFLEQCLKSVFRAMEGIEGEVFVVDNDSVDGSVAMVREKFPQVRLIANRENTGFSKANNQAIREAQGQYVLLLNPDTVVEEDTFHTCIQFMDAHADAGACGVKLIDGKGNYLPESKRGLPTPDVAFYKIFGFSRLFPKSRRFGRYHLGFLDPEETHPIEVLSGAFMFMRRAALDKSGLLDETFFMYGEDIDLSYRISLAGYKVYYHPRTRVIHYRGESTKKSSINYVFIFYQAMIIFAAKHFSAKQARLFSALIKMAVYLRAGASLLKRVLNRIALPACDAALFFAGMAALKGYWASKSGIYYPYTFLWVSVPAYIGIWMLAMWMHGAYEKPYRLWKVVRGIVTGSAVILIVYALLPEQYRYSRFLTLVGAGWAILAGSSLRSLVNFIQFRTLIPESREMKRILIVGSLDEANRIKALIHQSPVKAAYLGLIDPHPPAPGQVREGYTGSIDRLKDIVEIFGIHELIFCGKDLSSGEIMTHMMDINHPELEYKIAPPESLFIIGSNSIQTSGELYVVGLNAINRPENRRKKRMLDVVFSLIIIATSPIGMCIPGGLGRWKNAWGILRGKATWVSYVPSAGPSTLPKIKPGIIHPLDAYPELVADPQTSMHRNILYAKDYRMQNDVDFIIKSWRKLGRKI